MKLKRVLSFILVAAMLLVNMPVNIQTVRAEASSTDYTKGYSWSFDQTVTMGKTKGLVSGDAAGSVKVMNHEGNNSLTPGRAIADGVLTTTVQKNWGNTVGHAVFYKLPADLIAGRTYHLNLNLYGGNDAAAMNGITVSFGGYEATITGAGGTIQQWQYGKMDALHTDAKLTHALSGNLPTDADNAVVIEIKVTEAIAAQAKAGNWMLVTFPMALNGSYKLGTTTLMDNLLNVTTNLSNAALTTEIKTVLRDQSYENTVTADEGYGISKVTVTMGGAEVANAYDAATGKISIPVVNGHLHIQVEAAQLLKVTAELSKAALSNEIANVLQGQSYENTVIAAAGFEVSKVTVTMGGTEVANAYDAATGKISVAEVTGDLHIQVETVAVDVTNLLVNGSFNQGENGWGKNANFTAGSVKDGVLVIPTTKTNGDAIFYQSMKLAPGTYQLTFGGKGTANTYRPILYIGINQWSKVYGEHFLKNFGFGEEWKTVAVTFTIPASAADANTGLAPVYVALWTSNKSYAPETEMQLDNFAVCKLLSVTANLSNAALSTEITTVVQGQSYVNTVTANAGYEISKVTVTMGGVEVANAYDAATGKISIPAVTGDLNIQVEAVKLLSVTANLGNAVLSTEITTVSNGQSYENTVTASAGYEVSKVTVTMGGTEVANAYDAATGKISIAEVTGDLHIQVETVAVDAGNLLVNGSFNQGNTGWSNNGIAPAATIADGVLTLSTGKTTSGDARTYNMMQLAPGAYELSFDVMGTPAQYRPYVGVSKNYWTNDYGQYFMYNYNLSDSRWTTVKEIFTVPESAADANTGLAPVYVTVWNSNTAYAPLSQMHFDNFAVRKVLKVTTDLSNAALSTKITAVVQGQSYVNTVTANAGYEISKVTVTMGGAEVANAYDAATGKVTIPAVSGDVTIRVETFAKSLIINGNFDEGNAGWSSNAIAPAATIADGVLTLSTGKTTSGDARTYNMMQLAPGTYQLSFDVKGTPAQYRPYVGVSKNYWTNDYGQYFMYNYNLSDSRWTTVKEIFTVPESAADANTGLAPVYVTVWTANTAFAPVTEMHFDNFDVSRCYEVSVVNPAGKPATGLAEYTLSAAVNGAPFELVLAPETPEYTMTVSCTMGGVNVPVTVNADGTVTVQIGEVSGDIVITADSRKSAYDVTVGEGIANSNPAVSVAHGAAYSAKITSVDPDMKIQSLTCMMGRETVNVPVVDGTAAISIDEVTGDITITAVLVNKNTVAQWIFDVSGTVTGIGGWGDAAQTVAIAHNGYYDSKNAENGQPYCTAEVVPDLLSINTNLPAAAAGWAEASTVIGYKLPADLELGATYILNLPIHAGNENTTLVSSKNKSTRSGMELVFTTVKPENMWNAGDKTVTRIYAEGNGVLAASAPSLGNLSTDSDNTFRISFKVTEEIKAYAASGNYLALIINHQHKDGSYKIGNATLLKVTDPATVTMKIGNSVCDGSRVAQKGEPYTAKIVAKPGHTLLSVSYTMNGGEAVKLTITKGTAILEIEEVTGNIVISASTWDNSTKIVGKPAILGTRPNPSPYNDYPYICDEEANLMPNFGFEAPENPLENIYSKIEADADAWEGSYSLHYAPVASADKAENLLVNGDFAGWDVSKKSIEGWTFNNAGKMNKLEFVELDGRHAVKLVECTGNESFNMELMQKVYLEADFTYTFSFDFYGVAHWGPNLVIYDGNHKHISSTNSKTTGTEGEWTTLSTTFRPNASGYYYFSVRIHNAAYPQREQFISNCAVTLKSTRVEYELKNLKRNTDYWLTLFVKASKVEAVESSFITFGLTDPETGNFIVMKDPTAEGARPYTASQQLVPMAYDGQWHVLTVPFNTCDATRLNFTIDGLNCEAWFDNIYIFEELDAKPYVAKATDKDGAVVTDTEVKLVGCEEDKNLFENHDLNDGDAFWGDDSHAFGLFGNSLNVADSGSAVYGNALHYVSGRPTSTYYIKWIDVEPNTEYTFSAKYAIIQPGDGFMGLIDGYRMESEVTENRLFPTLIAQFGFGEENYLESLAWQTVAVSFNSGERNRIGFVICDAGGEVYIDELRLFKSADGIAMEHIPDTVPEQQEPEATESAPTEPVVQQPEEPESTGTLVWGLGGLTIAAAMVSLIIIQKKRKSTQ